MCRVKQKQAAAGETPALPASGFLRGAGNEIKIRRNWRPTSSGEAADDGCNSFYNHQGKWNSQLIWTAAIVQQTLY
jgi:hypothetical protein